MAIYKSKSRWAQVPHDPYTTNNGPLCPRLLESSKACSCGQRHTLGWEPTCGGYRLTQTIGTRSSAVYCRPVVWKTNSRHLSDHERQGYGLSRIRSIIPESSCRNSSSLGGLPAQDGARKQRPQSRAGSADSISTSRIGSITVHRICTTSAPAGSQTISLASST